MKKQFMMMIIVLVMMAISMPLLAWEYGPRDARDLKYLDNTTWVAPSNPILAEEGSPRDARDLKYLHNETWVAPSNPLLATEGSPRDARDLKYLHTNTWNSILNDENIRCLFSNTDIHTVNLSSEQRVQLDALKSICQADGNSRGVDMQP